MVGSAAARGGRSAIVKRAHWIVCAVPLTLVLVASGCGDDAGGTAGSAGAGATSRDGGAPAGSGAATGAGGDTAGAPGSGGQGGSGRVICGGVGGFICTQTLEVMGRSLGPCCDEDSGNICGVGFGTQCEGLNQAGEASAECPAEMDVLGESLPGCCRPDGKCGVLLSVGFGCVERTDVSEIGVGPFDAIGCSAGQEADAGTP